MGHVMKVWYEKIAIFFYQYLSLSHKLYKIGPWLLWNTNRKSYVIYQIVIFCNLEWPKLKFQEHPDILHSISQIVEERQLYTDRHLHVPYQKA